MGYMRDHVLVVSARSTADAEKAMMIVLDVCKQQEGGRDRMGGPALHTLVSPIVPGLINDHASFFIVAPDGSKEGWADSNQGDALRQEIQSKLVVEMHGYCEWVEVQFGDDDGEVRVVNSSDHNRAAEEMVFERDRSLASYVTLYKDELVQEYSERLGIDLMLQDSLAIFEDGSVAVTRTSLYAPKVKTD